MKKWFALMALLSIFFVSTCSSDSDELSGKTFKIAHPPVLEEELDNPSSYYPIVTLKFSKNNSVSNTFDDTEGTYKLSEDVLVINFENKNEKLKVHFIDFKESDKDFSSYSAVIGHSDLHIEDSSQVKKLFKLSGDLSEDTPVEFIEK